MIPEKFDIPCDKCGLPMLIRYGREGGSLCCSGYSICQNRKPFPPEWGDPKSSEDGSPPAPITR
jgi:DNA topoisomerase I